VSGNQEVTYAVDFCVGSKRALKNKVCQPSPEATVAGRAIPRIARLMALAIRFDGLVKEGAMRDYAEIARLGRVTRARVTQIMKLLHLAPDIQEQILFLPDVRGINERNLRHIVNRVDWQEQRQLFQKMIQHRKDCAF
jgi:hypothetical protein